jgi:hypothetical protein
MHASTILACHAITRTAQPFRASPRSDLAKP